MRSKAFILLTIIVTMLSIYHFSSPTIKADTRSFNYDKSKSWLNDELTITYHSKEMFFDFLNKHYATLKKLNIANLRSLSYYQNEFFNYSEKQFQRSHRFLKNQLAEFKSQQPIQTRLQYVDFYRVEKNKKKTIYYLPMPHVSNLYGVKPALHMLKEFSDYNVVLIDGFRFFTTSEPLSAKAAKEAFTNDLLAYLALHPDEDNYLSIVCFGYLLSENFLSNHKEKYKGLVLYAPMVKEIISGHQVSPNVLYDNSRNWMTYEDLLSLVYIVSDSPMAIAMPDHNRFFNKGTFANLFSEYQKGHSEQEYENAIVIVAGHDQIVPHENSRFSSKIATEVIEEADHLSPLFIPSHVEMYLKYSRRILK